MTAREIEQEIEKRINSHLKSGLGDKLADNVQWHIKMANQWIETLANFRKILENPNE